MGNLQVFNETINLLDTRFSYLAIDLPGHGQTRVEDREELYNMQNTALALIELLDSLAIKKCLLVGYSMGGRLALYLSLNFSHYFKKVVLESASPGLKTQQQRNIRIEKDLELAQKLESSDFSLFLSDWYSNPLFNSLKNHPNFSELVAKRLENNPLKLAKSLRNLSTGCQPSLWEKLQDNKIPTLLLVGKCDRKFREINTEMYNLGQYFQLEIVKECGHNIHWENPHGFAKVIKKFLME